VLHKNEKEVRILDPRHPTELSGLSAALSGFGPAARDRRQKGGLGRPARRGLGTEPEAPGL
jgi:hypothetical protein